MSQPRIHWPAVASVVGVLVVLGGCAASAQQRAARSQLERAQEAYLQAESDPSVQAYAPVRLAEAQKALQDAQQAKHSDEMLHLSYLAERAKYYYGNYHLSTLPQKRRIIDIAMKKTNAKGYNGI